MTAVAYAPDILTDEQVAAVDELGDLRLTALATRVRRIAKCQQALKAAWRRHLTMVCADPFAYSETNVFWRRRDVEGKAISTVYQHLYHGCADCTLAEADARLAAWEEDVETNAQMARVA